MENRNFLFKLNNKQPMSRFYFINNHVNNEETMNETNFYIIPHELPQIPSSLYCFNYLSSRYFFSKRLPTRTYEYLLVMFIYLKPSASPADSCNHHITRRYVVLFSYLNSGNHFVLLIYLKPLRLIHPASQPLSPLLFWGLSFRLHSFFFISIVTFLPSLGMLRRKPLLRLKYA